MLVDTRGMAADKDKPKKALLDLNDDCLFEICRALRAPDLVPLQQGGIVVNDTQANPITALKCFSGTCKRMRHIASPLIFRGIRIGHSWDWEKVGQVLVEIFESSLAEKYARRLIFETCAGDLEPIIEVPGGLGMAGFLVRKQKFTEANPDVALVFGGILRKMTKLEHLALEFGGTSRQVFEGHVPETALNQLSIKSLALGNVMGDWAFRLCPNIQASIRSFYSILPSSIDLSSASRSQSRDLLNSGALRSLPSLKRLELEIYWNVDLLSSLYDAAPQLAVLVLPTYNTSIFDLIPSLARFPSLAQLHLVSASDLNDGVSYNPFGPYPLQDDDPDWTDLRKLVAQTLFAPCKVLRCICFADGYHWHVNDGETNFGTGRSDDRSCCE
ncbi:hypothetical protein CKM354_000475000 [Cercospora kikuchii]|uniref:Uncharacterized protein n=1 Tax=Cercospora kikuchii TaxID=84275 RepID=A0A9P3FEX1_9PEZI|nr:uncharacterized protein CKM354_000475000 [Cercospora kikuchii]GIZ41447.1 hypothetical protein CKM354_000475000 [Cercospora kikuchii]